MKAIPSITDGKGYRQELFTSPGPKISFSPTKEVSGYINLWRLLKKGYEKGVLINGLKYYYCEGFLTIF